MLTPRAKWRASDGTGSTRPALHKWAKTPEPGTGRETLRRPLPVRVHAANPRFNDRDRSSVQPRMNHVFAAVKYQVMKKVEMNAPT
jgi:hypothetical protein